MSDEVDCPYCGVSQEIDHDDGHGYTEGVLEEQTCSDCDKVFLYDTMVMYLYESKKAPCMNGGEHDWQRIVGFPKEHFENRRRCSVCEKEITLKEEDFDEQSTYSA